MKRNEFKNINHLLQTRAADGTLVAEKAQPKTTMEQGVEYFIPYVIRLSYCRMILLF